MEKKPEAFPMGIWRSNKGKVSTHFSSCKHQNSSASMREDSDDITRILLTAVADPLARQSAEMSNTIILCTKILLTTQDPRSKELDHGGSGGAKGT